MNTKDICKRGLTRRTKNIPVIAAFCALLLLAVAVGPGCENNDGGDSPPVSPDTVGPEGGTIEVLDPASPLYGAKAVIPPGALSQNTPIAITLRENTPALPESFLAAGNCINFSAGGRTPALPVDLYLPYKDADSDGLVDGTAIAEAETVMFALSDTDGSWSDAEVLVRDAAQNRIAVRTLQFGSYLVSVLAEQEAASGVDEFLPDEYFVGKPRYRYYTNGEKERISVGCLGDNRAECTLDPMCDCGTPYVMTVKSEIGPHGWYIAAVIDKYATMAGGYSIQIDDEGQVATFSILDDSGYFPLEKVQRSGGAEKWDWDCEYITQHTHLSNYEACEEDSALALCDSSGTRMACGIEASGTDITITFGVDLSDELDKSGLPEPNENIGQSGMFVIAFEGNYIAGGE
ncbi:hypothetical protein ACFL43_07540 [Thermodesulfobacteriota bacterium]